MDLGYYYINFIIKDSVKEVLYGPGVLLHLFHHPKFCKRGSLGPGVLLQSLYHRKFCKTGSFIKDSLKEVL